MTITDIDKQDWKKEFEKKFMGEFCDGQGNGCYYETAPKIIDFIENILNQQEEKYKQLMASSNEWWNKKLEVDVKAAKMQAQVETGLAGFNEVLQDRQRIVDLIRKKDNRYHAGYYCVEMDVIDDLMPSPKIDIPEYSPWKESFDKLSNNKKDK